MWKSSLLAVLNGNWWETPHNFQGRRPLELVLKRRMVWAIGLICWAIALPALAEPDRTALPLAEPPREASTILDVRDATPPPRFQSHSTGWCAERPSCPHRRLGSSGGTSAFGGPVSTPSFDRIAREGIELTNFHTQATCSPTRAALLTGRNHHVANMGGIADGARPFQATPRRSRTRWHQLPRSCD